MDLGHGISRVGRCPIYAFQMNLVNIDLDHGWVGSWHAQPVFGHLVQSLNKYLPRTHYTRQ